MVKIGLRVYLEPSQKPKNKYLVKKDQRGFFEGLEETYDEWMPLFSPEIAQFGHKTDKLS